MQRTLITGPYPSWRKYFPDQSELALVLLCDLDGLGIRNFTDYSDGSAITNQVKAFLAYFEQHLPEISLVIAKASFYIVLRTQY